MERRRTGRLLDLYRLRERLFEVRIPEESPLAGKTLVESGLAGAVFHEVLGFKSASAAGS